MIRTISIQAMGIVEEVPMMEMVDTVVGKAVDMADIQKTEDAVIITTATFHQLLEHRELS